MHAPTHALMHAPTQTRTDTLAWILWLNILALAWSLPTESAAIEDESRGPMVFHKARAVAVPTSINVGEFALTGTQSVFFLITYDFSNLYSSLLLFFIQIISFHNVVFQLLVFRSREGEVEFEETRKRVYTASAGVVWAGQCNQVCLWMLKTFLLSISLKRNIWLLLNAPLRHVFFPFHCCSGPISSVNPLTATGNDSGVATSASVHQNPFFPANLNQRQRTRSSQVVSLIDSQDYHSWGGAVE